MVDGVVYNVDENILMIFSNGSVILQNAESVKITKQKNKLYFPVENSTWFSESLVHSSFIF